MLTGSAPVKMARLEPDPREPTCHFFGRQFRPRFARFRGPTTVFALTVAQCAAGISRGEISEIFSTPNFFVF